MKYFKTGLQFECINNGILNGVNAESMLTLHKVYTQIYSSKHVTIIDDEGHSKSFFTDRFKLIETYEIF